MNREILRKASARLRYELRELESRMVNSAFPYLKDWMVKNDPWTFSNYPARVVDLHTFKGRVRQKLSYFLWSCVSDANKQELCLTQMFVVPVEWNCNEQVDIEARIHGLPVIDPEQPFITEPIREVLNPNGKFFKVVMKRRPPAPVIPPLSRAARKRKSERAA